MNPYFAYGSNLWRRQMKERCPEHRLIGVGVLKGYRWIISERGYANIVKSDQDKVYGVVYKISPSDEQTLDTKEGVHSGAYRKEMMNIEIDNHVLYCLVYIDPVTNEGKPKQEYIDRINKGISDSNLPSAYVEEYIRRFVPA